MNVGSIRPQTEASMTIATSGRAKRARPAFAPCPMPVALDPKGVALPVAARPILTVDASGAPAAPAAPSGVALSFAARMNVTSA
ncbi:MAG: hypothetical protein V9G24_06250 [Rhodoblastus sp.]